MGVRAAAALAGSGARGMAEEAVEALGELRGLAAKAGQLASYIEGFANTEAAAVLARLQEATPASPPEAVRALLVAELGAPPEELFAAFAPEPFASASIGQVHRARLPDGRDVVVKVQHPGIAEALRADVANARLLGAAASAVPTPVPVDVVMAEVTARLLDELDYRAEAAAQAVFARALAGRVRVPEVIAARSTGRVLTSTFEAGLSLDEAAALPAPARARAAEALWTAFVCAPRATGLLHGDPHPGNLRFSPDGGLVLLDYGCVQPLPDGRWAALAAATDEPAARAALVAIVGDGRLLPAITTLWLHALRPALRSPFRVDRPHALALVDHVATLKRAALGRRDPRTHLPPWFLLAHRTVIGLTSVLARLDVSADYARAVRDGP